MSFSMKMLSKKKYPGGLVVEEGTWNGASVTTGDLVPDTTQKPLCSKLLLTDVGNDNNNATAKNVNAQKTKCTLTFTSSDTGTYTLVYIGD